MACVNLIPEIYFEEGNNKNEEILGVIQIPEARYNKECELCGSTEGVVVEVLIYVLEKNSITNI